MPEQHDQPQQDSESVQRSILKRRITMKTIDTAALAGYNAGIERVRLQLGIGLIELNAPGRSCWRSLPSLPQ